MTNILHSDLVFQLKYPLETTNTYSLKEERRKLKNSIKSRQRELAKIDYDFLDDNSRFSMSLTQLITQWLRESGTSVRIELVVAHVIGALYKQAILTYNLKRAAVVTFYNLGDYRISVDVTEHGPAQHSEIPHVIIQDQDNEKVLQLMVT